MPEAHVQPTDTFPVQFAWRLPDGGSIYAIFQAQVLDIVPGADKYIVRLGDLLAGRETNSDGESLTVEATSRDYWALVGGLRGRKITVAYEVDDGRAVYMRLETLTGEHNFFSRYDAADQRAQELRVTSSDSAEDPSP